MKVIAESPTRAVLARRLCEAAEREPRIVGLLDYGSGSFGRADEWSDVDVAAFVCGASVEAFAARQGWGWPWGLAERAVPLVSEPDAIA